MDVPWAWPLHLEAQESGAETLQLPPAQLWAAPGTLLPSTITLTIIPPWPQLLLTPGDLRT